MQPHLSAATTTSTLFERRALNVTIIAFTHLVVDLIGRAGEGDVLYEEISDLLQLLTLRPVVKCARDVDFFGGVLPERRNVSMWLRGLMEAIEALERPCTCEENSLLDGAKMQPQGELSVPTLASSTKVYEAADIPLKHKGSHVEGG